MTASYLQCAWMFSLVLQHEATKAKEMNACNGTLLFVAVRLLSLFAKELKEHRVGYENHFCFCEFVELLLLLAAS